MWLNLIQVAAYRSVHKTGPKRGGGGTSGMVGTNIGRKILLYRMLKSFCKRVKFIACGIILIIVSTSALSLVLKRRVFHPYIGLSASYSWAKKHQAQTLTLLPPFQNHYNSILLQQGLGEVGLNLGVERTLADYGKLRLGIDFYANNNISPEGEVWLFNLPAFNNLTYSYDIHHKSFMLSGQLFFVSLFKSKLIPYVTTSLGLAKNNSNNYNEIATVTGAVPMLPFANRSLTSFSWRLGIGIEKQLFSHAYCNVSYVYADLGKAALGSTLAATTNESLNIPHLYTHQLRLQLVYLI